MSGVVGRVAVIWRYPVKSMLGEQLPEGRLTAQGLAGDRSHAVLDRATGRVGSAKNPRLWRGLLAMTARGAEDAVAITLLDGTVVAGDDSGLGEVLSRELQRPVALVSERAAGAAIDRSVPEAVLDSGPDAEVPTEELTLAAESPGATFVDYAPLHLITTGTLMRIAALSARGDVEAVRYRPNLVIKTSAGGFVENGWVGGLVEIGADVVLRVIVPTPRCAVPSLAHGDLPADAEAVRTPFRHNRLAVLDMAETGCAGVYAQILRAGAVREGDEVRLREG